MGRGTTSNCMDDGCSCQHVAETAVRKMELCRKWKEAHSKEHEVGLHY